MEKVIVYANDIGGISVVYPTGGIDFDEVARKDVPAGVPYKIMDVSEVPTDPEARAAWRVDFNKSDEKGIGHEAWIAEQMAIIEAAEEAKEIEEAQLKEEATAKARAEAEEYAKAVEATEK